MKIKYIIVLIAVAFLAGCSKDTTLKSSVEQYDTEFADLPAYSEWGYNTFGAYYDRQTFIWNHRSVPGKIIVHNGSTQFLLSGQLGSSDDYYYDTNPEMVLTFWFRNYTPSAYTDVMAFNHRTLDLTDPAYGVTISIDTVTYPVTVISGTLQFKRIQNLLVDLKQEEIILSGYFDIKAIINNKTITISNGRFDIGIQNDNFYNY
jgi:hypothetical protein